MGSDDGGPLNLSSPAARGSSFRDLRWKGLTEDEPTALSLALEWRGDEALSRAEFSMDLERNWQRLLIQSERMASRPSAPRWTMLPDGSDVRALLASQPEVREEVSGWCEKYLQRSIEIDDVPPSHFRVTLRHVRRAALDVDLLDAGEGVIKVLPVLAAIALSGRPAPDAPRILALEEPESHLHPTLYMETHSQHILLGVQIAVARGQLRPEQVLVYWVHQDEGGRSVAERSIENYLPPPALSLGKPAPALLSPQGPQTTWWYCDTCGQRIERPSDGVVEWLSKEEPKGAGRNLRIVHGRQASPLPAGCQYEERRSDGWSVLSGDLEWFLGSDGLTGFYLQEEIAATLAWADRTGRKP